MTTLFDRKATCAACGRKNKFKVLGSTNAFGYHDLDTRPPEMKRSTISYWIQRCISCGYCSPDISEADESTPTLVQTPEYQKQLNDLNFTETANSFLCWSLINRRQGNIVDAAWAAIRAAWWCDDTGFADKAKEARLRAVSLMKDAREEGKFIAGKDIDSIAIEVDLLRRAGRLNDARMVIERGISLKPEGILEAIFRFQEALVKVNDAGRHTIDEALSSEYGKSKIVRN